MASRVYQNGQIQIKVDGLDELLRNMHQWEVGAKQDVKAAVFDGIMEIDRNAMRPPKEGGVPVDHGRLRSSHRWKFFKDGLAAEYGPHTDYAVYVHEGTHKMAPRPWLQDAFDKAMPAFKAELKRVLKRDL